MTCKSDEWFSNCKSTNGQTNRAKLLYIPIQIMRQIVISSTDNNI